MILIDKFALFSILFLINSIGLSTGDDFNFDEYNRSMNQIMLRYFLTAFFNLVIIVIMIILIYKCFQKNQKFFRDNQFTRKFRFFKFNLI